MPSWLAHFSETNLKTVETVCRTNFLTNVLRNNIFKFRDGRSLVNECRLILLAILINFYHKLRYQPLGTMLNISSAFFARQGPLWKEITPRSLCHVSELFCAFHQFLLVTTLKMKDLSYIGWFWIFFFHFLVSSKNFNTLSITKRFIFKRSRTVFLLLLENWQASNHWRLFVTR